MQNAEWITLFRQLPAEMHSKLILVQQNKSDISIDNIFRLEASYMVIRGRLGGTTETGLLFIVPYSQISTVYINREVTEDEVPSLLGPGGTNRLNAPSQQGAKQAGSQQGTAEKTGAAAAPPATPVPAQPVAPAVAARNNLLERLRAARNAAQPQANGKP